MRERTPRDVEIFIDTLITNNEERTVEQAAKKLLPSLTLKQLRYLSVSLDPKEVLSSVSQFNRNKEVAYIRRGEAIWMWDPESKKEVPYTGSLFASSLSLLRRDEPDTGASSLGKGAETGICYMCYDVSPTECMKRDVLDIFANLHASSLEVLL